MFAVDSSTNLQKYFFWVYLYGRNIQVFILLWSRMQLSNIKISNILSFPYQPDLSKIEGVKFHNKKDTNVNVLIWPNGAGKSWFLHIINQFIRVGIFNDYIYDKPLISSKNTDYHQVITRNTQYTEWLHPHFTTPDKPSHLIVEFLLTQHDYDNMIHISKHANILNMLIKKYSTLDIRYPVFSQQEIRNIPNTFVFNCSLAIDSQQIIIDQDHFSLWEQFVFLYLQTIELIQICIDIHNEFERKDGELPIDHLKNGIWFIGMNRSLHKVSNSIDPHAWDIFLWNKNSSDYHSYIWFYLCAKKIRNIISDHAPLYMDEEHMKHYREKLEKSDFYISLSASIQKYFNRTLHIEYSNSLITFSLIDVFGNSATFSQLSDGEQSLLSMVFTMYGYDLKDGMIIVNEPEIHFHPQMQRSFSRMIEKINERIGTQFILSTYSPLFINESNIGNVYRFSKIQWNTQIKNPLITLSHDEATLVHLLKFENLSKIFFVNNIIMVEWETDAYFFEFYLKYLHTLPQRKSKITDYEIININGKWSYKVRSHFLSRFGLQSFFIGDWDNIVDYGFMTQTDLWYYYKQTRIHYAGLKKSGKTHRNYNKLVDTIQNVFPKTYTYLITNIDTLYKKHVFILKKWDIEAYIGMPEKWLEKMVKFCHYDFSRRLHDKNFDSCRQEFETIFTTIFT